MTLRKHLFLDLEDTIIAPVMEGWWQTEIIPENAEKIRKIIAEYKPDVVNIFSFAIHNDRERANFGMGTKPMIERALGVTFSSIPIVEGEIIEACCNMKWISSDRCDFIDIRDFWGKQDAFKLWCRHLFQHSWEKWQQETEVMLLDDDVFNENFQWPDMHVTGQIIDITK